MMNPEMIALTAIPRELAALTSDRVPGYRQLWQAIVDGHLPAEQINGRYWVRRANLQAIAATMGLVVASGVADTAAA